MNTLQALQITWFFLWAVLWAVYLMLDGFVLGTGMLHPFLARNEKERRAMIATIGPVWNGNEVWLITAGGATFAAFPLTYALMFSYLYTPLLLLLFALIIRGVSIEFRGKVAGTGWKKVWDIGFQVGSFLVTLLLGVAFGNMFSGMPMDAAGYHGGFLSLLKPYALITALTLMCFTVMHGAIYTALKTSGDLSDRALGLARKAWNVLVPVFIVFVVYSLYGTDLEQNYLQVTPLAIVPVATLAALVMTNAFLHQGQVFKAFIASSVLVFLIFFTGSVGLFPNLIPSTIDPAYSLTIYNSSSSRLTLAIMTVVALIFVPIVIAYKIWVYRLFRGKISTENLPKEEAY